AAPLVGGGEQTVIHSPIRVAEWQAEKSKRRHPYDTHLRTKDWHAVSHGWLSGVAGRYGSSFDGIARDNRSGGRYDPDAESNRHHWLKLRRGCPRGHGGRPAGDSIELHRHEYRCAGTGCVAAWDICPARGKWQESSGW